jgi:hypothetical protein
MSVVALITRIEMSLFDSAGNLLTVGHTAENVSGVINNFVAAASEVHGALAVGRGEKALVYGRLGRHGRSRGAASYSSGPLSGSTSPRGSTPGNVSTWPTSGSTRGAWPTS